MFQNILYDIILLLLLYVLYNMNGGIILKRSAALSGGRAGRVDDDGFYGRGRVCLMGCLIAKQTTTAVRERPAAAAKRSADVRRI